MDPNEAVNAGAKSLVDPAGFTVNKADSPYLAPHVLVDIDHSMWVMIEESFGPAEYLQGNCKVCFPRR